MERHGRTNLVQTHGVWPSKSGKTTALKWLYQESDFQKGKFTSEAESGGQTGYSDYCTLWKDPQLVFEVFTSVEGVRCTQLRSVLRRGVDGVLFICDSNPLRINHNFRSLQNLRDMLGDLLGMTIPLIIALNKQDECRALPREILIDSLRLKGYRVFETVATSDQGLLDAFQTLTHEVLLKRLGVGFLSRQRLPN